MRPLQQEDERYPSRVRQRETRRKRKPLHLRELEDSTPGRLRYDTNTASSEDVQTAFEESVHHGVCVVGSRIHEPLRVNVLQGQKQKE